MLRSTVAASLVVVHLSSLVDPLGATAYAQDANLPQLEVVGPAEATETTEEESAESESPASLPEGTVLLAEPPESRSNADIWVMVGLSAASAGGALAYGLTSMASAEDRDAQDGPLLFDGNERRRLDQKAETERNLAFILTGLSVGFAAGATTLAILRGRDGEEVALTPTVAPGLYAVQLHGRF